MVKEIQPSSRERASAPDELVVPALLVGSAVARARRMVARSRRIPGLPLLFVGSARGLVKVLTPHVPALPWSAGLSPALLWGRSSRADRDGRASVGPWVLPEHPPRAALERARPGSGAAGLEAAPERPRSESRAPGLEVVAPALVLVRSSLGAPHREARAGSSAPSPSATTKPPAAEAATWRDASHRRARDGWGFALELTAARPASARVEPTAGAPPASNANATPPAPRTEASMPRASHAGSVRHAGSAPEERAASQPRVVASPEVLPWSVPSTARSGLAAPADAATAIETPAPLRLPGRDPRAAPVAISSVVEVAETLRTFVAKEVQEVKDAVGRAVASRPPEAQPSASPTPSDDTVRKLLGRMRTMMQEERFRSGKLR